MAEDVINQMFPLDPSEENLFGPPIQSDRAKLLEDELAKYFGPAYESYGRVFATNYRPSTSPASSSGSSPKYSGGLSPGLKPRGTYERSWSLSPSPSSQMFSKAVSHSPPSSMTSKDFPRNIDGIRTPLAPSDYDNRDPSAFRVRQIASDIKGWKPKIQANGFGGISKRPKSPLAFVAPSREGHGSPRSDLTLGRPPSCCKWVQPLLRQVLEASTTAVVNARRGSSQDRAEDETDQMKTLNAILDEMRMPPLVSDINDMVDGNDGRRSVVLSIHDPDETMDMGSDLTPGRPPSRCKVVRPLLRRVREASTTAVVNARRGNSQERTSMDEMKILNGILDEMRTPPLLSDYVTKSLDAIEPTASSSIDDHSTRNDIVEQSPSLMVKIPLGTLTRKPGKPQTASSSEERCATDSVDPNQGPSSTKQIPGSRRSNIVASLRDFLPMLKNLQERSKRSPAIKQQQQEVIEEERSLLKVKIPLSLLKQKPTARDQSNTSNGAERQGTVSSAVEKTQARAAASKPPVAKPFIPYPTDSGPIEPMNSPPKPAVYDQAIRFAEKTQHKILFELAHEVEVLRSGGAPGGTLVARFEKSLLSVSQLLMVCVIQENYRFLWPAHLQLLRRILSIVETIFKSGLQAAYPCASRECRLAILYLKVQAFLSYRISDFINKTKDQEVPSVDRKLEYAQMLLNTQRTVFPSGIPGSGSSADSLSSISSAESNAITDATPMKDQGIDFWRRAEELSDISDNKGYFGSLKSGPEPASVSMKAFYFATYVRQAVDRIGEGLD